MTREEAIRLLSGLMFKGKLKEALDMAIKALEQEPCGDYISREDAIMCMTGEYVADMTYKPEDIISKHIQRLRVLPPVTPQEPISDILEDIYIEIEKEYKDCVIGKLDDDEMYPCFRQITDIYGLLDIIDKYIDKYKTESEET